MLVTFQETTEEDFTTASVARITPATVYKSVDDLRMKMIEKFAFKIVVKNVTHSNPLRESATKSVNCYYSNI